MATSKSAKATPASKQMHWIAERRLERRDAIGGVVIVRIGCPEWPPGAEEWRCPFEIRGLGHDTMKFGRSIDSMAALQNALIGIRSVLEQSGIPLRWEGSDEDYTGFPMGVPWEYGLTFYHKIEAMIAAEIERLIRPIRERQEQREAQRKARKKTHPK